MSDIINNFGKDDWLEQQQKMVLGNKIHVARQMQ